MTIFAHTAEPHAPNGHDRWCDAAHAMHMLCDDAAAAKKEPTNEIEPLAAIGNIVGNRLSFIHSHSFIGSGSGR